MNKLILVLVFVAAAMAVSAASATPPAHYKVPDQTTGPTPITGVCASTFTETDAITKFTEIDYFDKNGNLTAIHLKFFDLATYTGPTGATLTGIAPNSVEVQLKFDSGGLVSDFSEGNFGKIVLPDGSIFHSAGRVDFIAAGQPVITPNIAGLSGNVPAFCAALGAS